MKKILIIILVAYTSLSLAITPEDGLWWNADESGRGITLEVQNGIVVATFYAYDDDRNGRWYLGTGTLNDETSVVTGDWNAFDGGQCSGCNYTAPSVTESISKGQFTMTFTTNRQGVMQWDGGRMEIERFIYAYPTANSYLYGLWSFTMLISNGAATQLLFMNDRLIDNGGEIITGSKIDFTSRAVVASASGVDANGEDVYTMLIDSSESFFRLYIFNATKNKMIGLGWLYEKTGNPSGNGSPAIGAKYTEVQPPATLSSDKSNVIDQASIDEAEFLLQQNKGQFDMKYMDKVIEMQEILENLK